MFAKGFAFQAAILALTALFNIFTFLLTHSA
jgi:hypothetical protein